MTRRTNTKLGPKEWLQDIVGCLDMGNESFTSLGKESALPGYGFGITPSWPPSGNKQAIVLLEHSAIATTWDQEAAARTLVSRATSHLQSHTSKMEASQSANSSPTVPNSISHESITVKWVHFRGNTEWDSMMVTKMGSKPTDGGTKAEAWQKGNPD